LKSPNRLTVKIETSATTALVYPAPLHPVRRTLILGHGAGAGQHSGFMVGFAQALSALGVDVVTFNFLYAEQRRRIPDRAPVLEACYRAIIDAVRREVESSAAGLFIGGKSMGGRIATQVAAADADLPLSGLVLLGYPLHPPGKPGERRDKHLPAIGRPMLFVQGSRDAFGTPAELAPVLDPLSPRPVVHVVSGGDHSFKIARQTVQEQAALYANIQQAIVAWMTAIRPARRTPSP
jgi:predicted alpha/beta-hydrolase family hydrolase